MSKKIKMYRRKHLRERQAQLDAERRRTVIRAPVDGDSIEALHRRSEKVQSVSRIRLMQKTLPGPSR